MNLRLVQLPHPARGSLLLSAMPGRFESLLDFEEQARAAGLAMIVCLTQRNEVDGLSPEYALAIRERALPCEWMNVPIPNFGVPADADAFRDAIELVAARVRSGDRVLLHCAAGIGRTGSAAACVLKSLGLGTADALKRVRDAGSNPENAAQSGFVDWF